MAWAVASRDIAVTFEGFEPVIGDVTITSLNGVLGFGPFTTGGAVEVPLGVRGQFGFGTFSVRQVVDLIENRAVAYSIGNMMIGAFAESTALAKRSGIRLESSPSFPSLGMATEIEVPLGMRARQIGFGPMMMRASMDVPIAVTAGPSFPSFKTDGEVFVPPTQVKASTTFPAFAAKGEFEVPAAIVRMGSFPSPQVAGSFGFKNVVTGMGGFPMLESGGEITVPPAVSDSLTLPTFGTRGFLDTGLITLASPGMQFAGFGLSGVVEIQPGLAGAFSFPAFGLSGVMEIRPEIEGQFAFPAFGLSGSLEMSADLTGAPAFPVFGLAGTLKTKSSPELSGAPDFPAFGVKGRIRFVSEGGVKTKRRAASGPYPHQAIIGFNTPRS